MFCIVSSLIGLVGFGSQTATAASWTIETVDGSWGVGRYSSVVLDGSGNAHISYYDSSNDVLKYARWTGSAWSAETVDGGLFVGTDTSIALDGAGNPHISYRDAWREDLKHARWTGTSWSVETVDVGGSGVFSSIALDAAGNPHISYHDWTNETLKYARWTGTAWSVVTVDSAFLAGYYTSIALDAAGNPHISYSDERNRDLKYARWTGTAWSLEIVDEAGEVGPHTSIALDAAGNPHISYHDWTNYDLKYARWTGTAWSIETVDVTDRTGLYTSIALDLAGKPHISYYDLSRGDLRHARWTGFNWSTETVDSVGDVGLFSSLALDEFGAPRISYYDNTNRVLKYARRGPDTSPPDFLNLYPANGSTSSDVTPEIRANYTDESGILLASVTLRVDGVDVTQLATASTTGVSYTPVALSDGGHWVILEVTDASPARNRASTSWSFTIDSTPPTVTILTPAEDDVVTTRTISVTGTASDSGGSGVARVDVRGVDGTWLTAAGISSWSSVTNLTVGMNVIEARAWDSAGNPSASSYRTVMYMVSWSPGPPTGLAAMAGIGQITLAWSAPWSDGNSPISNYRVYRGTETGMRAFLAEIGNVTTYTDAGLTNGLTYYYSATARNSIGEGPGSNEANATTPTEPSHPLNLRATSTDGRVTLTWQPPSTDGGTAITGYRVYRRTSTSDAALLAEIDDVLTYVDVDVVGRESYRYEVRAVNGVGMGPASEEASSTPPVSRATPGVQPWVWVLIFSPIALSLVALLFLFPRRKSNATEETLGPKRKPPKSEEHAEEKSERRE